jgi:hypothetical protein
MVPNGAVCEPMAVVEPGVPAPLPPEPDEELGNPLVEPFEVLEPLPLGVPVEPGDPPPPEALDADEPEPVPPPAEPPPGLVEEGWATRSLVMAVMAALYMPVGSGA